METTDIFLKRRVTTRMVETWGPLHLKGALSLCRSILENRFLVFPRDLDLGKLVGISTYF